MASSGKRQISSNVNGMLLDAPELFPIYERAAQRGLPMWIHPTTPVMLDLVGTKGNADLLFGWPMDTSLALFRLIIGGVLEKLPQLKVIVHHLGAARCPTSSSASMASCRPVRVNYPSPDPQATTGSRCTTIRRRWMPMPSPAVSTSLALITLSLRRIILTGATKRNAGARRRFVDEAQIDAEARQKIYEGNTRQLLHLA